MAVTYVVIVALVTYCLGAITKAFIETIPNRFIPLQNLIIGVISAVVCISTEIETNTLQAFVLCIIGASGAGGIHDLINKNNYQKHQD